MRVCDICKKPKTLYRLHEEKFVDDYDCSDLIEVGEFCRNCLDFIYGYINCLRDGWPQSEVEQIDHIKPAEVPVNISPELKAEMEKGFF